MSTVTVAIAQLEAPAELDAALDVVRSACTEAAQHGAQLVAFAETFIPGYPAWLDVCRDAALWDHPPVKAVFRQMAESSVNVRDESGSQLGDIARDAGITMVIGVVERVSSGPGSGTLYNSLLTYAPDGSLLNHHRKLMPTYSERMVWGTGDADGLQAVDTPAGRVGGLVCWEHWMPLARQAVHDSGEDIHVAVWPQVRESHALASRHYAFEGRCFVLAAGGLLRRDALPAELELHESRVCDGDYILRGGSLIIGPDGGYLHEPVYDQPAILYAALDLGRLREERMTLDVSGHYARPDLLQLRIMRETRQ